MSTKTPHNSSTDNHRLSLIPLHRLINHKYISGLNLDLNNCTFAEISSNDKYFQLVSSYIAEHGNTNSWRIKYGCCGGSSDHHWDDNNNSDNHEEEDDEHVSLSIGHGVHALTFEGENIYALLQSIGDPLSTFGGAEMYQLLILFINGLGKEQVLKSFCDYLYNLSVKTKTNFFKIYCWNLRNQYWSQLAEKRTRTLESVVLPFHVKDSLIDDLNEFVAKDTSEWYHEHGIPYKRCYLFFGPPGSGKSSFIQAIAGLLKRNVYYLQPAHPEFTDDMLRNAIISADKSSVIVMEDIDALFDEDRNSKSKNCPLTFSGLLNALDGLTNIDGHIFILTTNYIDRLDTALIRDGRVDYRVEFPNASKDQVVRMFLNFYKGQNECAERFGDLVFDVLAGDPVCMASIQSHFIKHRKSSPEVASSNFEKPSVYTKKISISTVLAEVDN